MRLNRRVRRVRQLPPATAAFHEGVHNSQWRTDGRTDRLTRPFFLLFIKKKKKKNIRIVNDWIECQGRCQYTHVAVIAAQLSLRVRPVVVRCYTMQQQQSSSALFLFTWAFYSYSHCEVEKFKRFYSIHQRNNKREEENERRKSQVTDCFALYRPFLLSS